MSEPAPVPSLPQVWRPIGPRIVGITLTLSVAAICVGAAIALGAETRAKFTTFQKGTLVFVALLALSAMYALIRSRAVATEDGLLVVNGYRRRELTWPEIVAVHLRPGAPWVTLDIADGTTVSVLAIQSSDGPRSRTAALELRRLAAARSGGRRPPPPAPPAEPQL